MSPAGLVAYGQLGLNQRVAALTAEPVASSRRSATIGADRALPGWLAPLRDVVDTHCCDLRLDLRGSRRLLVAAGRLREPDRGRALGAREPPWRRGSVLVRRGRAGSLHIAAGTVTRRRERLPPRVLGTGHKQNWHIANHIGEDRSGSEDASGKYRHQSDTDEPPHDHKNAMKNSHGSPCWLS